MSATRPNSSILIRPAHVRDVPAFGKIINDCAEYGLMLHRSLADLYENVRDFVVAVEPAPEDGAAALDATEGERVVGCCGLKIVWANLAEVYALAVTPSHRGRGLGKQLVLHAVDEAETLGIRRLMTLTYERPFFERCGFAVVDRQSLPLKVWSECARCPKNQACDEIAMVRELEVPDLAPEAREAPPPAYEVPVPLVIRAAKAPAS